MAGEMTPSGSRRSWLSGGAASISRSLRDLDDPFRRSAASRDGGDDEENLRWAALEKLPTYDRMRRGIIRKVLDGGNQYAPDEVDIANLDPRDGRELMERVFKAAEEDNERFLRRFRDRLDLVGIELPQIEVRYEHLSTEADVYVGKRALPTLLNTAINALEKVLMDKRSALYCLSMPASLTLLPTLPDKVPKDQHTVAAFIYGCIFSSATVGLVLSLHALDRIDLEIARFLSRLSVVGLAVLVVFYVSYALAPGNSWMLWFFMGVVFCGHAYAWIKSYRFKLDKPVPIPAEQPDGGD